MYCGVGKEAQRIPNGKGRERKRLSSVHSQFFLLPDLPDFWDRGFTLPTPCPGSEVLPLKFTFDSVRVDFIGSLEDNTLSGDRSGTNVRSQFSPLVCLWFTGLHYPMGEKQKSPRNFFFFLSLIVALFSGGFGT